ncbi:hypothetical protein ABKN59_004746 [Abortiporus biennis]
MNFGTTYIRLLKERHDIVIKKNLVGCVSVKGAVLRWQRLSILTRTNKCYVSKFVGNFNLQLGHCHPWKSVCFEFVELHLFDRIWKCLIKRNSNFVPVIPPTSQLVFLEGVSLLLKNIWRCNEDVKDPRSHRFAQMFPWRPALFALYRTTKATADLDNAVFNITENLRSKVGKWLEDLENIL